MLMFVPFGIIYCYYQKHFRVYKAVGMSCLNILYRKRAVHSKNRCRRHRWFYCKHIGKFDGNYGVCYSATYILQKSKVWNSRIDWYKCDNASADVCCLRCGNVSGSWLTKTVASSRCSVTVLWNFCLRIFNKGFYPQSKSLLSGMLCRNLLFKSGVTVETIEK